MPSPAITAARVAPFELLDRTKAPLRLLLPVEPAWTARGSGRFSGLRRLLPFGVEPGAGKAWLLDYGRRGIVRLYAASEIELGERDLREWT